MEVDGLFAFVPESFVKSFELWTGLKRKQRRRKEIFLGSWKIVNALGSFRRRPLLGLVEDDRSAADGASWGHLRAVPRKPFPLLLSVNRVPVQPGSCLAFTVPYHPLKYP